MESFEESMRTLKHSARTTAAHRRNAASQVLSRYATESRSRQLAKLDTVHIKVDLKWVLHVPGHTPGSTALPGAHPARTRADGRRPAARPADRTRALSVL
jgi:hypothetical protein